MINIGIVRMVFGIEEVEFRIEGVEFGIEGVELEIKAFGDFSDGEPSIVVVKLEGEGE